MALAQSYITVSRRPPDVEDYIDMMRRYRSWIIGPMFAGLVVATVVAFFWPDTYVSRATLRITPQQISQKLVPAEFNTDMGQRLQDMQTQILSRTTLEAIIRMPGLDLYKREQSTKPMEDIVNDMRANDIRITLGSTMLGGEGGKMMSSFSITFKYPDRFKAQKVVAELVSRFTERNQQVVSAQKNLTTEFVDDALKAAKARLDELDGKITAFNIENQGKLPEEFQANSQMMNTLTLQSHNIQAQIQNDQAQRMALDTALTGYMAQKDFAEEHLEDTVNTPQAQFANQKLLQVSNGLQAAEENLASLKKTFGEEFPAIKEAKGRIELLQQQKASLELEQEKAKANTPVAGPTKVTNPLAQQRLIGIQNQIEQVNTSRIQLKQDIERLTAELADTKNKISMYQSRIDAEPVNVQRYAILARERAMALEEYDADVRKKNAANQSASVEDHKAGEQLDVLDPASAPEQPTEPKRPLWAAIGTGLGLMVGLVLAGGKEVKNTSLKNLKDVRAYTNMPVLSSIPLLENALLVRRKRRLYWLAWSTALIIGFLAMGASMYYYFSK